MEINMKGYNLDSFQDKDIYTWDEIVDKIESLEAQIKEYEEKIENLEHKPDEWDEYDRCEDDYR